MYSFPQQEKIFKDLLGKNTPNKECADCSTIGPTCKILINFLGASLNFGVFLCSNCSGAHRALGPTVTRIKSTKLDQWQKNWMDNMQIGNKEINAYWEENLGLNKKPKMGAGQPELLKYATEKYVKKKFVKDLSIDDPLTRYKNGTYYKQDSGAKETKDQENLSQTPQVKVETSEQKSEQLSNKAVELEEKNLNLLEFELPNEEKYEVHSQYGRGGQGHAHGEGHSKIPEPNTPTPNNSCSLSVRKYLQQHPGNHGSGGSYSENRGNDDEQFSQYTEFGTSFTGATTEKITYEDLLQQKKSTDNQSIAARVNISNDGQNFLSQPPHLNHAHSASSLHSNSSGVGQGYSNGGMHMNNMINLNSSHQHHPNNSYSPTHHHHNPYNNSRNNNPYHNVLNYSSYHNIKPNTSTTPYQIPIQPQSAQSSNSGAIHLMNSSSGIKQEQISVNTNHNPNINMNVTIDTNYDKKQQESGEKNWIDEWK